MPWAQEGSESRDGGCLGLRSVLNPIPVALPDPTAARVLLSGLLPQLLTPCLSATETRHRGEQPIRAHSMHTSVHSRIKRMQVQLSRRGNSSLPKLCCEALLQHRSCKQQNSGRWFCVYFIDKSLNNNIYLSVYLFPP